MRFSKISLVLILFLASCAIPTIKGLTEFNTTATTFSNPYFANVNTDYVYKAKINAYDNTFGGLLIIKKLKENNHRIVFTTNFGNKIFDFELHNDAIITHFVMPELDRKVIINTLKHDFKTLTQEHHKIDKAFKKSEHVIIYQSKSSNRYNHFEVEFPKKRLSKITNTTNSKEKIIITFQDIQNSIAGLINIQHKTAPIQIDLVFLDNKN